MLLTKNVFIQGSGCPSSSPGLGKKRCTLWCCARGRNFITHSRSSTTSVKAKRTRKVEENSTENNSKYWTFGPALPHDRGAWKSVLIGQSNVNVNPLVGLVKVWWISLSFCLPSSMGMLSVPETPRSPKLAMVSAPSIPVWFSMQATAAALQTSAHCQDSKQGWKRGGLTSSYNK